MEKEVVVTVIVEAGVGAEVGAGAGVEAEVGAEAGVIRITVAQGAGPTLTHHTPGVIQDLDPIQGQEVDPTLHILPDHARGQDHLQFHVEEARQVF